MSLIKSADVPKHMADWLQSRRIAARLSGGAAKQAIVPAKGSSTSSTPNGPLDGPTTEALR